MRVDPRYSRVSRMLSAVEIPRLSNGGIALCHHCQRWCYFKKGFLPALVDDLRKQAAKMEIGSSLQEWPIACPACGHSAFYEIKTRGLRKCKSCGKQYSRSSQTKFAYSKLSPDVRRKLINSLKVMSIGDAARECGVTYRTAWRYKGLDE